MSEEQRKVYESSPGSVVMFNDSGPIPGNEPCLWLQSLDITPHDFPYLQPLITDSYMEWQRESAGTQAMKKFSWALLSHEGTWLTGAPEIREYLYASEDDTLSHTMIAKEAAAGMGKESFEGRVLCSVPLFTRVHGDLFGVLVCVSTDAMEREQSLMLAESHTLLFRSCFYRQLEYIFADDLEKVHSQAEREVHRRSILFQYVKRMHVQINVDNVLIEAIDSVLALYPRAKVELFMSQDHESGHPLVRPLLLHHWQEEVYVRTFMEGTLTIREHEPPHPIVEIGIPMGGKQGVYGVLHVEVDKSELPDMDLELLGMMADAAGTAFENAKLYEQSNLMIHELRMINELTQRLNKSLHLAEIFQFANHELLKILEADYCCILIYNEELGGLEVVSCNAEWLAKEVFEKDYGLGGLVYHSKEPLILSDYHEERPAESRLMDSTNSSSMIATPLTVNGEVRGVVLLTHAKRHYFSYDSYRLLQALTSHIGLAIGNAFLHAEVRRMANRDMLTELYARHYLDEMIHECQNRDFCGSLIVVDIDEFKLVNDTFGHQRGDKILKQVSSIVKSTIRHSDIPARWGGEELAVYLPGLGIQQAVQVAERIRLRVAEETDPRVTVSCGVSEWNWTNDKISVESLFYRADMALYEAKNSGRNRIVVERAGAEIALD
ncbi:sensor domain-containing diguanylate cyclase [Paenibacillus glucanolyticus]|uniref:sensor domain-containing diguanylate cyclase n=1 Tax=Paenibacillus glucanolyticus TaxID=59843 RepID=UPI00096EA84A|nr:sensor domain-containing diguanylate cyclase [Paenibacillus glucanolyticus]OMF76042.1 GGDEF domain-containing protein [Paenibacillus glucanolyticus]